MKRWGADVSLFDPNMSFAPASGIGGLSQLNLQRLLDQVVDGARGLRERPLLGPEAAKAAMQDSSWADGLRGIAALYVVSSHIVLCFARRLVLPCCGPIEGVQYLWQRPVFRLLAQGHSWVAIFFLLSGFVNALKPIKLARAHNVDAALKNLTSASFRRTFRLMLPAAAATIMSWFICQLGMYHYAQHGDAYWLYTYTPGPSPSWGTAIEDLVQGLRNTWTFQTINQYDQPQWALIYLLQGSAMTFSALLMTVTLSPLWRNISLGVLALWSFDWSYKMRDRLVGFTIFAGIMVSEFSLTELPPRLAGISPLLSPPLILLSLVLMSHPSDRPDLAGWSHALQRLGLKIFPTQGDMARTWGSVGGALLLFAILISPHARRALSRPPLLWLGHVSFPIYLLHGTFMRSLMAWLVFAGQRLRPFEVPGPEGRTITIERYAQPSDARVFLSIAISMSCMLVAAHWWAKKMEPIFAKITKAAEDLMTAGGENGAGSPSRPVLPTRKE